MSEEKRNNDRPEEDGTLNSGGPRATPLEAIYLQGLPASQPQEGDGQGHRESDPPIVVRDDKADHMAKERADGQRGQSTHAGGTNTLHPGVSSTLSALGTKAAKCPEYRFRSLARLLDGQMLREAFHRLRRKAAPGIDGVCWAEYAEDLEENLLELESRLRAG